MADLSDRAIDAAARALHGLAHAEYVHHKPFDARSRGVRNGYREMARAAIVAYETERSKEKR